MIDVDNKMYTNDFIVYTLNVHSKKFNNTFNFLFSTTNPPKKIGKLQYYSTFTCRKRIKLSLVGVSKNIIFDFDYTAVGERGISFENLKQYLPHCEEKNGYVFIQKNKTDNSLHIYSK